MDKVNWQKWVGDYKDRLSAVSKTHLTEDGIMTLCGLRVPAYADGYEVDFDAPWQVTCKKCGRRTA
jgi:hypothetical protein